MSEAARSVYNRIRTSRRYLKRGCNPRGMKGAIHGQQTNAHVEKAVPPYQLQL